MQLLLPLEYVMYFRVIYYWILILAALRFGCWIYRARVINSYIVSFNMKHLTSNEPTLSLKSDSIRVGYCCGVPWGIVATVGFGEASAGTNIGWGGCIGW